jgi:hypothetical protein
VKRKDVRGPNLSAVWLMVGTTAVVIGPAPEVSSAQESPAYKNL